MGRRTKNHLRRRMTGLLRQADEEKRLQEVLNQAGERLAEVQAGLKVCALLTDHAGNGTSLTNGGNAPAEEIPGAEVREGLRFLLLLVAEHVGRTAERIDPAAVVRRLKRTTGGGGDA